MSFTTHGNVYSNIFNADASLYLGTVISSVSNSTRCQAVCSLEWLEAQRGTAAD